MFKSITIPFSLAALLMAVQASAAADVFPRSGIFNEPDSESELDFGKRYLGFPDEECTFKAPKRLKANTWHITTTCTTADPPETKVSTAVLEKRGKTWRLKRGEFVLDFAQ
jgi:hypothetical protein